MTPLDQLRTDIEDHARRVGDARRRYRRDILSLTTWPGLDLERAMWMLPARERFTKEARALRLEAAELAAKGRALSSHPAQPDIEDVEALVRELSGALPATVSHAAGPMHHLVEGGTALNPALQTPVDTKRQGSMTPVYED